MARATGWRSRFSLEYRRTVTTRAGKRFVVSASPRCLAGASASAFLPWPAVLGWIVIRQFDLLVSREPSWQVEVTPSWEPNSSRVVAYLSKADAIRRVDSEASALASGR